VFWPLAEASQGSKATDVRRSAGKRSNPEANRFFFAWRLLRPNTEKPRGDPSLRFASDTKRPRHARIFRHVQIVGKQYRLCGGEGGIRTLGTGYPVRQISNLVPSTTRPPLRSMKSSIYAVFASRATSKVSKKCPRFLEPVVRLFASRSTESVSTFLNQ
jgi:hypothetical protein